MKRIALQNFFERVNEQWLRDLVNTAQDLRKCLPLENHAAIDSTVKALQDKWTVRNFFQAFFL